MEILVPMKNSLRIGALISCFALLSGALSVRAYAQPYWISESSTPGARYGSPMAYDAAHGQVVLFGGLNTTFHTLSDTWVWNGPTGPMRPRRALTPARPRVTAPPWLMMRRAARWSCSEGKTP
jgi:hypothetical protein